MRATNDVLAINEERKQTLGIIPKITALAEKLGHAHPWFVHLYAYPYREIVAREIEIARVTSQDKVLNVGCGTIPFTALHIANLTRAEVWAVDYDGRAVQGARRCLKRLGLDDQVSVFHCDASLGVPEGFDVAIVALQAAPKAKIMEVLWEAAAPGARMVFRQPAKRFQSHYDAIPSTWRISDSVEQSMKTFDQSILIETDVV